MKLIIAEKPVTANYIIRALGGETFKKDPKDGFYENPEYIVSWAISHLFELDPKHTHKVDATEEFFSAAVMTDGFCLDNLEFIPIESKTCWLGYVQQFWLLQKLMAREDVDEVIHAGFASPDGEIMIRTILHEAECIKPVTRLFTPDFTPNPILSALQDRKPLSEYDLLARKGYFNMYCNFLKGKRYVLMGLSEEENESLFGGNPLMR